MQVFNHNESVETFPETYEVTCLRSSRCHFKIMFYKATECFLVYKSYWTHITSWFCRGTLQKDSVGCEVSVAVLTMLQHYTTLTFDNAS